MNKAKASANEAAPIDDERVPGLDEAEALKAWLAAQLQPPPGADAAWERHRMRRRRLLCVNFDRVTRP
jgi:hypothetical protein